MDSIVRPVCALTTGEITAMLRLMQEYYLNVHEDTFKKDLSKKSKAILLFDRGSLCGFSTWLLFRHQYAGQRVNVIFSGDTITDGAHRGSLALPVAWGRLMLEVLDGQPDKPLFWLLTSKGYKTYRFLPVFFKEFYPRRRGKTSDFEVRLLINLARERFGDRFSPDALVVRARDDEQRLRPGVGDVTCTRLRDPDVAFFYERNPNYERGDELVCLARCHADNITPFMLRQLRG